VCSSDLEVSKAREGVEERLLTSFERIRKSYRNGLAVVPIVRESCGGCFNTIPPQRQSEIKQHKKIIVCENCGRILVDTDLHDTVTI
jgi:predicted  nucleic acid-binding Zn-ribbon protein